MEIGKYTPIPFDANSRKEHLRGVGRDGLGVLYCTGLPSPPYSVKCEFHAGCPKGIGNRFRPIKIPRLHSVARQLTIDSEIFVSHSPFLAELVTHAFWSAQLYVRVWEVVFGLRAMGE